MCHSDHLGGDDSPENHCWANTVLSSSSGWQQLCTLQPQLAPVQSAQAASEFNIMYIIFASVDYAANS